MLNEEQALAVDRILTWLAQDGHGFFLLEGSAGTGKTFCVKEIAARHRGRMVFTAPTNKATRVLKESLQGGDYRPECRTIYSLLGLQMAVDGELKVIAEPEEPIDLSRFRVIVLDEGSMVNSKLFAYLKRVVEEHKLKVIVMADFAQLPPVGEGMSPTSKIEERAKLGKVMRHDNKILELATTLRGKVDHPAPSIKLETAYDNGIGGVIVEASPAQFEQVAIDYAYDFAEPGKSKLIAWRNVTVDRYNKMIRNILFPDNTDDPWLVGDRALLTGPVKDADDKTIGHTDDEGEITHVRVQQHPFDRRFKIFRINLTLDDSRTLEVFVLHPLSFTDYRAECERLAAAARLESRKWRAFWQFKEQFHGLRHAYAITAHRAQGSTYETTFVDYRDILLNRNRSEAYRCLYVACTRPKRELILG